MGLRFLIFEKFFYKKINARIIFSQKKKLNFKNKFKNLIFMSEPQFKFFSESHFAPFKKFL